jgi:hypothetical protein
MRQPYDEGDVFAVPLRKGGFAHGVVARVAPGGKVLFGYFFGPKTDVPGKDLTLHPADSLLKVRFGDLGLINGEWPVVGKVEDWDRGDWPMPEFVRRDPLSGRAWKVRYMDGDPSAVEVERPTDAECDGPTDSLSGYGAVEIRLTKLLD